MNFITLRTFILISISTIFCVCAKYESCDSGKGICIDTNSEICDGGTLKKGYCSGSSNIICCEYPTCDSGNGICLDTTKQTCDGVLKPGYCPGSSAVQCCEENNLPNTCLNGGPPLLNNSYEFTLNSQGFPGHPGALVYIPSTFSKESQKIELVVYIHGYYNCIRNIVRPTDQGCNCSNGGAVRDAFDLIGQFERAASAVGPNRGNNWIFVAAEVAFDQANDSPGHWADSGLFRKFVDELLSEKLAPLIGTYTSNDLSRVRIFSHSGGYYVIGNMAIVGGLQSSVMDLTLLDSLYANFDQFDTYVKQNLCSFGTSEDKFRFTSLYTVDGGTYSNNVAMAKRATGWVSNSSCVEPEILYVNDDATVAVTESIATSHSMMFKLSSLSHNDMPRQEFYNFLVWAV